MTAATIETVGARRQRSDGGLTLRDSTWLPALPRDWQVKRLKFLASTPLQYGASESGGDQDDSAPRFVRITDIDENGNLRRETRCTLARELARPYLLRKGDILFARSGATVGKSFLYSESWGEACFAGYLIRLRPRLESACPEFISYFTASTQYWAWIGQQQLQATIQNVSAEKYANLYVPLPPLPEQRAIAAFLDRETARIDALIEKKERLIALLEEEREAVITHAVARGLGADPNTKDSGYEWIGLIPVHWEMGRVSSFCRIVRGGSPRPAGDPRYFNGDHTPWITVGEVTKDDAKYLTSTDEFLTEEGRRLSRVVQQDTFILTNSGATLGVPKILGLSGCINDGSVAFLDVAPRISKDFLYYFFKSQTRDIRMRMNQGMGQPNLNTGLVSRMAVPLPPIEEQNAIARALDATVQQSRRLADCIQSGIDRLREYRTALISAAVTGQIDVRDEVPLDA